MPSKILKKASRRHVFRKAIIDDFLIQKRFLEIEGQLFEIYEERAIDTKRLLEILNHPQTDQGRPATTPEAHHGR